MGFFCSYFFVKMSIIFFFKYKCYLFPAEKKVYKLLALIDLSANFVSLKCSGDSVLNGAEHFKLYEMLK